MSQVLHAAFVCVKHPSVTLMDPTRCPGHPLGHSEPNNRVNNVHTEEGGSSQNQLIRTHDRPRLVEHLHEAAPPLSICLQLTGRLGSESGLLLHRKCSVEDTGVLCIREPAMRSAVCLSSVSAVVAGPVRPQCYKNIVTKAGHTHTAT